MAGRWAALYGPPLHTEHSGLTRHQTAFALGAFATTITTLSCALVEWRGLTMANAFIGNFFFIAGIGMVLSAQWELVRGNSYNYTVFSAYGNAPRRAAGQWSAANSGLQACSMAGLGPF